MGNEEYSFVRDVPKKKKKHILLKIVIAVVILFIVFAVWSMNRYPRQATTGYPSIDLNQMPQERCEAIAAFMDDYLENLGYFPMEYSVEWIGYCKYSKMYTIEEYQDMATGGYYTYMGNLSTGEVANARVSTYWEDGEDPVVVSLTVETLTTETPIVEYTDEKINECWEIYNQRAFPDGMNG